MHLLVTGGAGYIGSIFCLQALKMGYTLEILDNFSTGHRNAVKRIEAVIKKELVVHECDIRDSNGLNHIFKTKFDAVVHLAGLKSVAESALLPLDYYETNVFGTLNILRAMDDGLCEKILFSSSATVYGDHDRRKGLKESDQTRPCSPYGRSKLMVEQLLFDWARDNKRACCLRYFNPVGATDDGYLGESPQMPNNLMPILADVAIGKKDNLEVFGNDYPTRDGTCERDYVHILDLVSAHLSVLVNFSELQSMEIFNVGTGESTSVLSLIKEYEIASKKTIPYRFVGRREGDTVISFADPTKIFEVLGWKSERSIKSACQSSWRWTESNPHRYDCD